MECIYQTLPQDAKQGQIFKQSKDGLNSEFSFSEIGFLAKAREPNLFSPLAKWEACSPMAQETRVQCKVEWYQRLKKWYSMLSCLTLSITRYVSRVKWSNPRKEWCPLLHIDIVAIEKGAFELPSTMVANFPFFIYP